MAAGILFLTFGFFFCALLLRDAQGQCGLSVLSEIFSKLLLCVAESAQVVNDGIYEVSRRSAKAFVDSWNAFEVQR